MNFTQLRDVHTCIKETVLVKHYISLLHAVYSGNLYPLSYVKKGHTKTKVIKNPLLGYDQCDDSTHLILTEPLQMGVMLFPFYSYREVKDFVQGYTAINR